MSLHLDVPWCWTRTKFKQIEYSHQFNQYEEALARYNIRLATVLLDTETPVRSCMLPLERARTQGHIYGARQQTDTLHGRFVHLCSVVFPQ